MLDSATYAIVRDCHDAEQSGAREHAAACYLNGSADTKVPFRAAEGLPSWVSLFDYSPEKTIVQRKREEHMRLGWEQMCSSILPDVSADSPREAFLAKDEDITGVCFTRVPVWHCP